MDYYRLGSLFLDISLVVLVLGAIIRLAMVFTYFKRNGSRALTDNQRKHLKKTAIPIVSVGLVFGVASLVLLLIC